MAEFSNDDDPNPSILTLVVDVDFSSWKFRKETCQENQILYQELVSSLIMYCNTYVLMHRQNRLCVLLSCQGSTIQIYPRRNLVSSANKQYTVDDFVPLGHLLPSILAEGFLSNEIINGIQQSQFNVIVNAGFNLTSFNLTNF